MRRVDLTVQHQSPAHVLSPGIKLPYQGFLWRGELRLTGLLPCILLLREHRPHRQLWARVYSDLSADLVHLQMSQDRVLNCMIALQEDAVSCINVFQTERNIEIQQS